MRTLVVSVPGEPVPTARVRVLGGRASTPRRTVEYQSKVAKAVRAAMREQGWPESFDRPVRIYVSIFGAALNADGENVTKGLVDAAVKAKAVKDDALRYVRAISWVYGGDDDARVVITVEELEGGRCW